MDNGAPQGSPLSPVLWIIYIATSLKRAEEKIGRISIPLPRSSERLWERWREPPQIRVHLVSDADNINPVIKAWGSSRREHRLFVSRMNDIMEEEAAMNRLK